MSKIKEQLMAELENKALEQNITALQEEPKQKGYSAELYKYDNIIDLDFLEYVRKNMSTTDQLTIFEAIEWYLAREKQLKEEEKNDIYINKL